MSPTLRKIGKVLLIIGMIKAVLIALGIAGYVIYKHFIAPQIEEDSEEETQQ